MKTLNHLAIVSLSVLFASCSTLGQSQKPHAKSESAEVASSALKVQRYVGSEPGFKVTSNLIIGSKDAILVDAQFTRSDASKVKDMILASGKNLKTVFVTHAHPEPLLSN